MTTKKKSENLKRYVISLVYENIVTEDIVQKLFIIETLTLAEAVGEAILAAEILLSSKDSWVKISMEYVELP